MADEQPTRLQRMLAWIRGDGNAKVMPTQPKHYQPTAKAVLPSQFGVNELIDYTQKCINFYRVPRGDYILDRFKDTKEDKDRNKALDIPYSADAIVALAFTEWIGTKDPKKIQEEIKIWNSHLMHRPEKFFKSGIQGSGFFQINEREINRKDKSGQTKKGYVKKDFYDELFDPQIYRALKNYTPENREFLKNKPRREVLATAIIASWFESRKEPVPTLAELTHPKNERKAIEQSIPFLVATVMLKQEETRLLWNMGKKPPAVRFENLPIDVRMALVYVGHVGGNRIPMISSCRKMKSPKLKDVFSVFDKASSGFGSQLKTRGYVVINPEKYFAPLRFAEAPKTQGRIANLYFRQQ